MHAHKWSEWDIENSALRFFSPILFQHADEHDVEHAMIFSDVWVHPTNTPILGLNEQCDQKNTWWFHWLLEDSSIEALFESRILTNTLPPIITEKENWVPPILVSFHLGDPFSTEPMDSWEISGKSPDLESLNFQQFPMIYSHQEMNGSVVTSVLAAQFHEHIKCINEYSWHIVET